MVDGHPSRSDFLSSINGFRVKRQILTCKVSEHG